LRDAPAWFSSISSVSATPPAAGSSLILFVIYMASGKAVVLDWLRPSAASPSMQAGSIWVGPYS
jgi:hypothetical protein